MRPDDIFEDARENAGGLQKAAVENLESAANHTLKSGAKIFIKFIAKEIKELSEERCKYYFISLITLFASATPAEISQNLETFYIDCDEALKSPESEQIQRLARLRFEEPVHFYKELYDQWTLNTPRIIELSKQVRKRINKSL